jgi:hypothetical protein
MKMIGTVGIATATLLMLGACEVTVNNKSMDNQVDAAADRAGNLADSAGEALEKAGAAVETGAESLGNKVDRLGGKVQLNIDTRHDNESAEANRQ